MTGRAGMDIAIIGGGIGGLAAGWLLGRRHRVTLYEREEKPGFVAHAVPVPGADPSIRVDVPLRVLYRGYYPTLMRLYARLGVETEPVSYASSFMRADGRLYFRYRNTRFAGRTWPYVLPQDIVSGEARALLGGMLRFNREAPAALAAGRLDGLTIGRYVAAQGFAPAFVNGFLLPAIATIATCSYDAARAFPAPVIVGYLARGLTRDGVRRVRLGAEEAARALVAALAELRCGSDVSGVRRAGDKVLVQEAGGATAAYDHVVLATQANQSRRLLGASHAAEDAVLAAFRYQPVEVVMHTDPSLMPARRADWSPVNLMVEAGMERPMSTIWINAVQPALRDAPLAFQTVHPLRAPRAGTVIRRARFERPLVDDASLHALARLAALHAEPERRVWLCGSWAQDGIPLLESAVRSADAVAAAIDPAAALG
jgi:predicted NAD/FAD-binding protein